jgi:hypothetical protein
VFVRKLPGMIYVALFYFLVAVNALKSVKTESEGSSASHGSSIDDPNRWYWRFGGIASGVVATGVIFGFIYKLMK